MSNSDRPLHTLTVRVPEPGLEVLVLDAEDRIVARGGERGEVTASLPHGLYVVRTRRGGAFVETPVRLDASRSVVAEAPLRSSAATVPGARTTHEYYTYPAWHLSQHPTAAAADWSGPADASLLLFVRAPEREAFTGADQLAGLRLCTPEGVTVAAFADDEVQRHADGWSAYSAMLSPGLLVLEDGGVQSGHALPRQLPVPLWPGRQTQLFVMHHGRPLWEGMHMAAVSMHALATRDRRSPYDSDAKDVRAALEIDAGLLALQNGATEAAPRLVEAFLQSKFENPVLGLLGGYLLLLRAQSARARGAPASSAEREQIGMVLDNLSQLIPDSADVAALRLMAEPWLGHQTPRPVAQVPLFRHGAEVLLHAAAGDPTWLPEGGWLDAVSERLYADTVWTSWAPPKLRVSLEDPVASSLSPSPDWVEVAVVDAIAAAERRQAPLASDELVRSIGVSPRAVREAMGRLVARATEPAEISQAMIRTSRLLGSPTTRDLVRTMGVHVGDDGLLERLRAQAEAAAVSATGPNIHHVYATLKKTLAGYADQQTGRISADTVLDDLLRPEDDEARRGLRRRLARGYGGVDLTLSAEDLDGVDTLRDMARLIKDRGVE